MTAPDAGPMRTMRELTVPYQPTTPFRMPPDTPLPPTSLRFGEDVLISNVTSFEVKFTGPRATGVYWPSDPASTEWPRSFAAGNTDWPYDNLPFNGEFDTFCGDRTLVPNWDNATNVAGPPTTTNPAGNPNGVMKPGIRITAIIVRIRAWDSRTQQTRQTTMVQDL
jgi:hypothetical protein